MTLMEGGVMMSIGGTAGAFWASVGDWPWWLAFGYGGGMLLAYAGLYFVSEFRVVRREQRG